MVRKIVSGGQTGADRAALDVALELGTDCGGWVPRGRAAEDGAIPDRYRGLRETPDERPETRTEWNVRDSDATVILSHGALFGGSALTEELALRHGKPVLHLDLDGLSEEEAVDRLCAWLVRVRPSILNVAGPRAGNDPTIYSKTRSILRAVLRKV